MSVRARQGWRTGVLAAAAGAAVGLGCAAGALGQSYEVVYKTGDFISGVGVITSPFRNGMPGFYNAAINNSGQMWVHVGLIGQPGFDEALLHSDTGRTPFLVEGNDGFLLGAPSEDHVVDEIRAVAINNVAGGVGAGAFAFTTQIVDFPVDPLSEPTSGVYLGDGVILIEEGDATGFDAASVWDAMGAGGEMTVRVNDANQWLIGHSVTDGGGTGISRRVIVRVQSDGAGANLGESLIAREGGAVAGGSPGETWTALSIAPHALAMNNSGNVIFTGRTSAGREGVFLNGAFVALTGGATPTAGRVWGPLLGAAVDLNNGGDWIVRAVVSSDGTWAEGGGLGTDAGEDASGVFEGDREITGGGGALTVISGTLSNDHDVDVYRIRITDPAAFSATTVGGPAEFDSVLWLIQTGHNFNGSDRSGLGRNDDANLATELSALGATNAPGVGDYYLCVSTARVRPVTTDSDDFARGEVVEQDLWQRDPSSVALDAAAGRLWWADPSEGTLRSVTTAGAAGAAGPAYDVAAVPTVPELTGAEIVSPVAFDTDAGAPGGGWVYFWADSDTEADGDGIRRTSADGSVIEDVVGSLEGASGGSALAIDEGRGKVYWARRQFGQVWRANLDGSAPEMLIGAVGSGALLELAQEAVVTAVGLAVDEATGDVFAADPHRGSIVKMTFPVAGTPTVVDFVSSVPAPGGCACETDGTAGVNVFDLLAYLDLWFPSDPAADIDGTPGVNVFDLLSFLDCWFPASAGAPCGGGGGDPGPVAAAGLAIDQASREVYFTDPTSERVLRAALIGASAGEAEEVVGAGGAPGAHAIAVDAAAGKVYWTDIDGRAVYRANRDGSGAGVYFDIGPETADSTADGDFGKRSPFNAWAKLGEAGGPALPYEVHLTGAAYSLEGAMIAKNNTVKVAAFGDLLNVPVVTDPNTVPPTTVLTPTRVNYISRAGQPVRISDGGDVLWLGEWGGFGFEEGLFLNQTVTLTSVATPAGISGLVITTINSGANALDMSDNGRWAVVQVTDGRFTAGNEGLIRVDFGP